MLNLMLESVVSFDQSPVAGGTTRATTFTLSPGVRGGWNIGEAQLITGVRAADLVDASDGATPACSCIFSYELPFKK